MSVQSPQVETADNQPDKPVAYVSMSPQPDLEPVYVKVLKPALERLGLECRRNENRANTGLIIDKEMEQIDAADLVICDLTYNDSLTYYELALSHAFQKQTILISQSVDTVPFDARYQRMISYTDDRFGLLELRDNLVTVVSAMFPGGAVSTEPARTVAESSLVTPSQLEAARISLYDRTPQVRRYAMRVLSDYHDKAAYETISWLIKDESWNAELVRDGLTALYKIDPERALEEDFFGKGDGGIRHSSYLVRERIVNLLGNYSWTPELVEKMVAQSSDSSWGVRVAVCQLLGKWCPPDPTARSALERLRGLDVERSVRVAAEDAINAMDNKKRRDDWAARKAAEIMTDATHA